MRNLWLTVVLFVSLAGVAGCGTRSAKNTVAAREHYAYLYQDELSKQVNNPNPWDVTKTKVTATGNDKTTLQFENAQYTAQIAKALAKHQFSEISRTRHSIEERGFSTIAYTNGISTWTVDMQKGDWQSIQ